MLGKLYYGALLSTGITSLARRLRDGAPVFCYHNVVPDRLPQAGEPTIHLPLEQLKTQLLWLRDHYTVISLHELVSRLTTGVSVRGLAAITFDDGYAGTLVHAWPLLRELGLPATMFIVAAAPCRPAAFWWDHPAIVDAATPARRDSWLQSLHGDRDLIAADASAGAVSLSPPSLPLTHLPADWSVVAEAAATGLDLGAHSVTHRTLTTLDDSALAGEVAAPAIIIHEHTGVRPLFFSYPYGIWDGRVRQVVREAGYRAAFTLDYGRNTAGTDLWSLRRINIPASISPPTFAGWAAGVRPRRSSPDSATTA
jgi:peptidoglycan/xylan/chitin deacetylase (PgdA/CDA1 family)